MEKKAEFTLFCAAGGLRLRNYQQAPARAIIESVISQKGFCFVVMFPRQSGKNELQAQIECYLLALFAPIGGDIIKVSPTWRPQSLNAMQRLEQVLRRNRYTRQKWQKESGYIYRVGQARVVFLSGEPTSNIVGATARLLLSCDEAQDVSAAKWDKEISPMAAAYNTTRVFWGTAWTSHTLLGRELRLARAAQAGDRVQRVFVLTADQVAQEVPAYGGFVAEQVRRLGRSHPMIRTQYFSEELEGEGTMFNPGRLALMQGAHPARSQPESGKLYALLVDVGGEEGLNPVAVDEVSSSHPETPWAAHRDSTALTVVEVKPGPPEAGRAGMPIYCVVHRHLWTGLPHTELYQAIQEIAIHWQAVYTVIDATGVGAGLASFLKRTLGVSRLVPFQFNSASKSDLGWRFLGIIETGRYQEFRPGLADLPEQDVFQSLFWEQARSCQSQVQPGPSRMLKWGVPGQARSSYDNTLLHDDFLTSAALCAVLEQQDWGTGQSAWIPGTDILNGLRPVF